MTAIDLSQDAETFMIVLGLLALGCLLALGLDWLWTAATGERG